MLTQQDKKDIEDIVNRAIDTRVPPMIISLVGPIVEPIIDRKIDKKIDWFAGICAKGFNDLQEQINRIQRQLIRMEDKLEAKASQEDHDRLELRVETLEERWA